MRILLINLTRFGDLLQTQPTIHALHDMGHRIGLVCLDNFAEAGKLLDGIETIFPLPAARLFAVLDADWRQGAALLHRYSTAIQKRFSPDCVLNLTSTPGARLLTRRLSEGRPIHGFSVDEHGFGSSGTLWGIFFEAATRKRGCSPYNLADVFRKVASIGGSLPRFTLHCPDPGIVEKMTCLLKIQTGGLPPGGYVAFQLGASEERRRWPVSQFATLGRLVHKICGTMPVLLGSASERALATEYLATGAPAVDLVGQTSLQELASVLSLTRLLVTNDTGTMHLAAGLGLPSLAIFLATAQPCDTGPYLEDCCCLEPALACHPCAFGTVCPQDVACRDRLTSSAVWPLVRERLLNGRWPEQADPETRSQARVWLTTRDETGFLDLRSLSGHETEERSIWLRLQRHFYRQFLDTGDSANTDFCQAKTSSVVFQTMTPQTETARIIPPLSSTDADLVRLLPASRREELLDELGQLEALCELLLRQGEALTLRPLPQAGKRFLGTVNRISSFLEHADPQKAFDALARLWTVASQERGGDLHQVMELATLLGRTAHAWADALAC